MSFVARPTPTAVLTAILVSSSALPAATLFVGPSGRDTNPGSPSAPLQTLKAAQAAARNFAGREPVQVRLLDGVYHLSDALVFTDVDSGTAEAPVRYEAAPGAHPVISGGTELELTWTPYRDGLFQAAVPPNTVIDQLFVNGRRQSMARFPNAVPGKKVFDVWNLGERATPGQDALAKERVARWQNPAGGYLHAMHAHLWGDQHWLIDGKNPDDTLKLTGGWQNNRPTGPHPEYRFVENIFEELDAPGEWYFDRAAGQLYYQPEPGVDLVKANVEIVRLRHLIEFRGSKAKPVRFVDSRGFTFTKTTRTFMENREPLLRSDWTVYRGGAVVYDGAEDCTLADCTFDQVGGNTIFINGYNRRLAIRGCLIRESGANGIAFVGNPQAVRSPLFNYGEPFDYAKIDRTPGPQSEDYPADCLVEDCLITRTGRMEKQTAPIQISMAQSITVRHCSIYDVPRAGINISEGTWGGHIIEFCDVFDTVNETGDHGSFNSWGRDRYWHPSIGEVNRQVAADPALPFLDVIRPNVLRNNRWRCDHGWDVDLDDGSTRYEIYNNLMLGGGLKLREGYQRTVYNNITVGNTLHPHCWYDASGDEVTRNLFMGAYRPAGGMPKGKWGKEVDRNLFTTSEADRLRFAGAGCDTHSLVGDPLFVNPAAGDFCVREGSPALKLGFENFPMDVFGVRTPELRRMARTPEIPAVAIRPNPKPPEDPRVTWRGATVKNLVGQEYSAVGMAADQTGAYFVEVPESSAAFRAGLRPQDVVIQVAGKPVSGVESFTRLLERSTPGQPVEITVVRQQAVQRLTVER